MKLIHARDSSFQMGGDYSADAQPVHTVIFTHDFWIDTTEVTQRSYLELMGINPSAFTGEENRPVERTTWFDAVLYCNKRSKRDGLDTVYSFTGMSGTPASGCVGLLDLAIDLTKNGYRLPTEAEWEYACKGGTETDYFWDTASADANAWYFENSNQQTHPVARKLPNPFGLYDMCGNVWEWCNDWYEKFSSASQTDPTGIASGTERSLRGGSWHDGSETLLSAYRTRDNPMYRLIGDTGFRCAISQQ